MITAFVGIYDESIDDENNSSRGGGKTTGIVYYLHADYENESRHIFTNFKCSFAKVMSAQNIVNELIQNQKIYLKEGVSVGLTEMQTVLNSLGSSAKQILFLNYWAGQTRKLNCDLNWDIQRYWDANNRLRSQTDNILKPMKYHANGKHCRIDRCTEHHYVKIFSEKPYRKYPITDNEVIDTWETGKLYDTNELVFDNITFDTSTKEKRAEPIIKLAKLEKIKKLDKIPVIDAIICPNCKGANICHFGKHSHICFDCDERFKTL